MMMMMAMAMMMIMIMIMMMIDIIIRSMTFCTLDQSQVASLGMAQPGLKPL